MTPDLRARIAVIVADPDWAVVQRRLLALAGEPGVPPEPVAAALVDEMPRRADGLYDEPIGHDALRWLAERAPAAVTAVLDDEDFGPKYGFVRGLDALDGDAGTWAFGELLRRWPSHTPETTSDRQRVERLRAIAEAGADEPPFAYGALSGGGGRTPPPAAVSLILRIELGRRVPPDNWSVHRIGRLVLHGNGVPLERTLIPWAHVTRWPDRLRLMLLAWAPDDDAHRALVAEALAAGDVSAELAAAIGPEGERPAWIDGEASWTWSEARDGGEVRIPDGRLAACDPLWGRDDPDPILVEPGWYAVTLIAGVHDFQGTASVALVLTLADRPAAAWEPSEPHTYTLDPFASFAAVAALETREEIAPGHDTDLTGRTEVFDLGPAGTVVATQAPEQHPLARTWLGRDRDGRLVRVLTDFVLGLDPVADPVLPWERAAE